MADAFNLKILTPAGVVATEQVVSVKVPTAAGEIEVLPKHCTYVGLLGKGSISYKTTSGASNSVNINNGAVQFSDDTLTILADG